MQLDEDNAQVLGHGGAVDVLRLLMVDDHVMLTEALSKRFSEIPDLWVVGRCATADKRLPGIAGRLRPDLVTVDVEQLGPAAGDFVRGLRAERPAMDVVVLTGDREVQHAVDSARAGVAAWVPKESGVEELAAVFRGVRCGRSWFPPEMLGAVLRELRADARRAGERNGPLDVLSDRELDVLAGMVDGKRGAQIGSALMISTETVRTHVRSILAKLHVHSQLEAISVASAAGFRGGGSGAVTEPPVLPAPRGDRRESER
ncbi:LuxR C-terminal-related transcriptional regulator [Parasphingorhabdus pacifica]